MQSALTKIKNQLVRYCFAAIFCLMAVSEPAQALPQRGAVAAEHPRAAKIGLDVLKAGGNAVDAAVATAFAACVLNPSSCGLGGGGFMLIYVAREARSYAVDFREVAPAAISVDMLYSKGKLRPERLRRGGLAIGVPGYAAGLLSAHSRFGTMSLEQLLQPTINLAEKGYRVGPHLATRILAHETEIAKEPELRRFLLSKEGLAKPAGTTITRTPLAGTLRGLAKSGASAFYQGATARAIAGVVRARGGVMTEEDLLSYRPIWRQPLQGDYRGLTVLTMPPPSSGGVLLQMLNLLSGYHLSSLGLGSATYLHILAEVMKAGFHDRTRWYGDPSYTSLPLHRLLSKSYADSVRHGISMVATQAPPELPRQQEGGTSHLSVIDQQGNAVACTVTINTAFGAFVVAPGTGVILNNEMDDFSLPAATPNIYGLVGSQANEIAPGKRPLSSMSPTILIRDGKVRLAIGASGGPRIITSILQVLLAIVDFDLGSAESVAMPRIHHQGVPNTLFMEPGVARLVQMAMRRLGHEIKPLHGGGAVQVVQNTGTGLTAAADNRKQGGVALW